MIPKASSRGRCQRGDGVRVTRVLVQPNAMTFNRRRISPGGAGGAWSARAALIAERQIDYAGWHVPVGIVQRPPNGDLRAGPDHVPIQVPEPD